MAASASSARLKMQHEHYQDLKAQIARRLTELTPAAVLAYADYLEQDPHVLDPAKRMHWDLMWSCRISHWVTTTLYPYLDDTHIDSALRLIMQELAVSTTTRRS